MPIGLSGRILKPDGTGALLLSTDRLVIPEDMDNYVSSRTVAFYLDPNDISIEVYNNSSREV